MKRKYTTSLEEEIIKDLKKKAVDLGVRPNVIIESLLEKFLYGKESNISNC